MNKNLSRNSKSRPATDGDLINSSHSNKTNNNKQYMQS